MRKMGLVILLQVLHVLLLWDTVEGGCSFPEMLLEKPYWRIFSLGKSAGRHMRHVARKQTLRSLSLSYWV